MIEPAFQTLLVSTIGFTPLLSSCFLSAVFTAVSLSTITRSADVKRCPTPADPLAENDFGGRAVAFELDTAGPSCQAGSTYSVMWRFTAATSSNPGRYSDRGFTYRQRSTLHDPPQRASMRG